MENYDLIDYLNSFEYKVKCGIKALDKAARNGLLISNWRTLLANTVIEMGDSCKCILGILFGDFETGLNGLSKMYNLKPSKSLAMYLGFMPASRTHEGIAKECEILRKNWLLKINS